MGPFLCRLLFFLTLIAAAGGCAPEKQWQLQDISGHLPDLQFTLTDDSGNPVTAQNYQGDVMLLYFGFAGCGTQCPIVLHRLTDVLQQLGGSAEHVRVLFVTVDPAHDTPQVLHSYIGTFDAKHMIGLAGSDKDTEDLARRYRAAWRPHSLVHGTALYIFDTRGQAQLLAAADAPEQNIVHDLRQLLKS
jgi:protein SCO1/2